MTASSVAATAPVAVVTGASRGIGRAIAIAFADRGCDVALLGRAASDLEGVATEVARRGRRGLAVVCDVAKADDVELASRRVRADLGVPRFVVPNAGVAVRHSILETTEAEWDAVIDVNLKGTFLTVKAFLPAMLAAKAGRFVAMASISATMGTPRLSAYCAAKWGTVGFVKSLAEELRKTGLQAMCVLPGSVDTDMLKGSGFAPAMTPEDVARTVMYLALDAPDAMNGSALECFG